MKIAKPIVRLIDSFRKLPGIGPKTAQRLTFYLLHVPQEELDEFAKSVSEIKTKTKLCSVCRNISEEDPCPICTDESRDKDTILVVEQPLDILAFERTGKFKGLYHVLHGSISPLDNIGPDELFVNDLFDRVFEDGEVKVREVIVATNPTMEGDATAMYIAKKIRERITNSNRIDVSRLGMGVPTGADLEYADDVTLTQAIEGRRAL